MLMGYTTWRRTCLLLGLAVLATARMTSAAAPAADTVFPADTVAFVSIADPNDLSDRFRQTLLGQLVDDQSMEEFARHLRDEAVNQVGDIKNRLALTVDDLFNAAGGELALGVVHRRDAAAALVVTLDVTGKQAEADAMLAKVEKDFLDRGAKKTVSEIDGVTLTRFDLEAPKPGPGEPQRRALEIVYFQRGDLLVAVDFAAEAEPMLAAATNGAVRPLSGQPTYQQVMKRVDTDPAGERADVRWFIDPFQFDEARSTMQMPKFLAERKDMMTILADNGFKAIQAVGGVVGLALDSERDFQHCTAFYAPGNQTGGKSPAERFQGAMRICDAPGRRDMGIEKWAPRSTATYNTFNLNIQGVFDNLAPLFDAVAGYEDAFKTTLEGFEKDPFGPKINIRNEIIAHLGSRVTVMTDYHLPVTPDCERYLFVVEVKGESALRRPLDKLMKSDGAVQRELKGVSFWEVIPEEEEQVDLEGLPDFDDPLFDDPLYDDGIDGQLDADAGESNEQHSAVCLHEGRLIVASDVSFLEVALFGVVPHETLAGAEDFQFAAAQLGKLAPWVRSAWSFARYDETVRPTYELIRAGKMPEAQTFFGRLLNQALTTPEDEEQGIVRQQRLDGSTMPSYELARRYFGPSVRAVRTDDDGWLLVGVLLNKSEQ